MRNVTSPAIGLLSEKTRALVTRIARFLAAANTWASSKVHVIPAGMARTLETPGSETRLQRHNSSEAMGISMCVSVHTAVSGRASISAASFASGIPCAAT